MLMRSPPKWVLTPNGKIKLNMEKRKNKKVGMNYGKSKKNYRGNVQGNYGSA